MMRTRYRCVSQLAMLLMLVSAGGSASGHQDFVIDLQRDGTLRGLPPRYEPARLSIPNGEYHAGHNVILQLGGHRVEFPECLSILFTKASRKHIQLSASWYHDPSIVPYYLSIELPTRARSRQGYFDGWSILVALETGNLISVEAEFESEDGWAQRGQKINLSEFCTAEEVKHLAPREELSGGAVSHP